MNQILDHSGPKKPKAHRDAKDIEKIIKVYAIIMIVFAFCFIGKAAYTLTENKKIKNSQLAVDTSAEPRIVLNANNDLLDINASYSQAIDEVSYQWYRGNATMEDIHKCMENTNASSEEDNLENDDEEDLSNEDTIVTINDLQTIKGEGQNEVKVQKIGIPKGETTVYIIVKAVNGVSTEYIQNYYTDVGVDKIEPKIQVSVQGKKLIITARDETEIDYITYSINDENEEKISDRVDKKTIKTEIDLDETQDTKIQISAVDKSKNTGSYNKTIALYVSKPKIEFLAESDYSKIYVTVTYPKGLTKVEYNLNGKDYEKTFDNPEDAKEVEFDIETDEGDNVIVVKAYTEEESVYAEETGECTYTP